MIECPECGLSIKGRLCKCGYKVKGRVLTDEERQRLNSERGYEDARHLEACRQWLTQRRIIKPGMTIPERQKAMAEYRSRLAITPRPGPRDWAAELISREADGEILPGIVSKLAHEAMKAEVEE